MDPLATALSLTCELTIQPQLPQGEQWDRFDALIVVGVRHGTPLTDGAAIAQLAAAAGFPDFPTLILVASDMTAATDGAVTQRSYPISLADLGAWLGTIPAAAALTQAA